MAKNKQNKRIIQGGNDPVKLSSGALQAPTIVMQMAQVFMLDLQKYKSSIQSAQRIDGSNRTQLYDMYESALMDSHLAGVLDKRLRGVTQIPIEFHRDGKKDDIITPQLRSPWFKEVRKEIILSKFWGFTLLQFYLDDEGNIRADKINRKHYNPLTRELLKQQTDQKGIPIEEFPNTLFIGEERHLGIFADIMPAVLYKRGNMSDWARFLNVFGIPIRKYTYDAGDEEARRNLIRDAQQQGSSAVFIHPKESNLEFLEPKYAMGTGKAFEEFTAYWDNQITIRILGNTLTTDAKDTGTQALGSIHKEVEDEMNADDREAILDILNYYMRPIFANLGFNVDGGEFVYVEQNKIHPTQQVDIVLKLDSIGVPISHDYLYEMAGIPKPENYDELMAQKEAEKQALQRQLEGAKVEPNKDEEGEEDELKGDDKTKGNDPPKPKKGLRNTLASFFGLAPQEGGADNDF